MVQERRGITTAFSGIAFELDLFAHYQAFRRCPALIELAQLSPDIARVMWDCAGTCRNPTLAPATRRGTGYYKIPALTEEIVSYGVRWAY